MIMPAFGIVSEIVPVFSRKPLFGYSAVVFSGVAIAILGFGVWAHHMFTVGMGPVPVSVFSLTTMLIALPTGVKIFNWIFTMWGGHLSFKSPMLFVIGFIAMFMIGGFSGVMNASPPVDAQQQDSYFVVAHFHYVLFGGSVFGLFGGIYYWFPKVTGKMFNEALAKTHFWLMFIGFNLVFMPMHWLGLEGMPRRIYTYQEDTGWGWWNMFISLGLFVLALGFVAFIINMLMSLVSGDEAPVDPWDAATLEWSIPSPPPAYNFARIPTVTSRIPLWTEKYPEVYGGDDHGRVISDDETTGEIERHYEPESHDVDEAIHLPNPSIWPFFVALGITIGLSGLMIAWPVMIIGALIAFVGVYGWALQPAMGDGTSGGHEEDSAIAAGRSAH
jgi:cytochrome c oxidase subunit 1